MRYRTPRLTTNLYAGHNVQLCRIQIYRHNLIQRGAGIETVPNHRIKALAKIDDVADQILAGLHVQIGLLFRCVRPLHLNGADRARRDREVSVVTIRGVNQDLVIG